MLEMLRALLGTPVRVELTRTCVCGRRELFEVEGFYPGGTTRVLAEWKARETTCACGRSWKTGG